MLLGQTSSYKALIIGEGVRIRSDATAKGKEKSKVYGNRQVEIIEVGKTLDGLGKDDMCEKYPWIKVNWQSDSTGWVYGKYVYYNDTDESYITKESTFTFQSKNYQLLLYRNYGYPPGDENGLTGCAYTFLVYIYDISSNKYYQVKDNKSKKDQINMVLYSNDGIGERVSEVKGVDNAIHIFIDISYQDGGAEAFYILNFRDGSFNVTDYSVTN